MNENLNLVKILKDCPRGTKLYSPIFGEVELREVCHLEIPHISVFATNDNGCAGTRYFNEYGKYWGDYSNAECMLWPSRECRDWSQFKKPKPEPKPKHEFKPFDRVLVRDDENCNWEVGFFDHYNQNEDFPYRVMTSGYRKYCIPYEGNEHLHHTWNKPNE